MNRHDPSAAATSLNMRAATMITAATATALLTPVALSGIDQPSATLLPRLATALGRSPLDLLDVDPTRPPLAALRLAAGLTLQVLATQTGISYNRCRRLEHGARVSTEEELRALASALRIDVGRIRAAFAGTSAPGNR
jgi:Helix-turn-helix domain